MTQCLINCPNMKCGNRKFSDCDFFRNCLGMYCEKIFNNCKLCKYYIHCDRNEKVHIKEKLITSLYPKQTYQIRRQIELSEKNASSQT